MKAALTLLCFIFFTATGKTAFCQYQDLSFNHISVNNGLSQGVNNCIYKDSKGYIWISSFDGLNRFDGTDCVIYRDIYSDSSSVKGTLFLNILEDRNNNLWIGSNEGLNFYDRRSNSFKCFYKAGDKLRNQTYSPFYIDNDNNIWLQSGQNILLFNSSTKQFSELYIFPESGNLIIKTSPAIQHLPLQKIFVARRGGSLIYSAEANPLKLSFRVLNISFGSVPSFINSFFIETDSLWIGTNKGLFYYSGDQTRNIRLSTESSLAPNILSLHIDNKNTVWAGTEKDGLFCLNKNNNLLKKQYSNSIYNPYSISGNQVQYIYSDEENNLWVAVWGKGVDYVNLEKFRFQHYLTREETNNKHIDNFIRSIVEAEKNRFWCGTQLNGILVLDENKKIISRISNGLPPSIEHILKDSKGNIWIATFSGLFRADSRTEKIQPVTGFEKYPPAAKQFNYIYELQNGSLLASSNAGIFLIDPANKQIEITVPKGISSNDVYLTTFQSATGDVYLSRAFKGFSVYRLYHDSLVLKKEFYDQSSAKCFLESTDSMVWVATTKGLLRFNKINLSVTKTYTTSDGLINQYIYGILANDKDLWLSTNAGISKFNTADNSFKNFTVADGLQSNEFNTYSFCRSANGEFLFGGVNGINAFYPTQLKKNLALPRILLQHISINDTTARSLLNPEDLEQLNLLYSQNTVSFQFAVIDYTNPSGCSFLYKLEGYDKDWISSANKSIIRYANLPPGNYVLKAKAVSAEGIINEQEYSKPINVETPWHKTWWFTFLVLTAIALLIFYFVKTYLEKKFQKQKIIIERELAIEQERTRMARDLHDGLGSMLSGIKHSFSALGNQITLDESQQGKFHSNIDKLNESITELRNITHSIASEGLLQFGLENSLRDYCKSISQAGALHISFEAIDTSNMLLTEEQAFHIFRIVQELLQNIIKHSQANHAIVQVNYNEKYLYITVEDDGKGFEQESGSNTNGMGLKNIESRVKIVKGKADYKTAPGEGTSVLIKIPCSQKP